MEEFEIAVQPVKRKRHWVIWTALGLVLLALAGVTALYGREAWNLARHGVKTVRT